MLIMNDFKIFMKTSVACCIFLAMTNVNTFPKIMLKVYLYAQTYIDLQFVYNHSKLHIGNMFLKRLMFMNLCF